MTDYGQFYDDNDNGNLLPVDVPSKPTKRCSAKDTSVKEIIKYAKALNKLRKEASDAGVCLDELEEVAKELA